jgi:hypothetical protein
MHAWLNGAPAVDASAPPCQATDATLDDFVKLALVEGLLLTSQLPAAEQAKRIRSLIRAQSRWSWLGRPQFLAAAALVVLSLILWKLWPQSELAVAKNPPTPPASAPTVQRPSVALQSVVDHSLAIEYKPYHYKLSAFVYPEFDVTNLPLGEALHVLLTAVIFPSDVTLPEFYIAPDLKLSELRNVTLRLNCVSCQSLVQIIALQAGCRAQRSGNGFYLYQDPTLEDTSGKAKMEFSAKETSYFLARQNTATQPQEEATVSLERALRSTFDEPLTVAWVTEPRYRIEASPRLIAVIEELRRDIAFTDSHYEIQADPLYVIPNSPLHKKMRAQAATKIAVLGIFPRDEVKQNLTGAALTLTHAPVSGPQGVWLSCGGISLEIHRLHNEIIGLKNKADALRKNPDKLSFEALAELLAQNQQAQADLQARHDAQKFGIKFFPHPSGQMQVAVQIMDTIEVHALPENSTLVVTLDAGDKPVAGIVKIRPVNAKK